MVGVTLPAREDTDGSQGVREEKSRGFKRLRRGMKYIDLRMLLCSTRPLQKTP